MTLLFVGPDASEHISSLAMDGDSVWAAVGSCAIKYSRGKEILRLTNPLESLLSLITVFGSQILALTDDGSRMFCWNTDSGDLETTITFEAGFHATHILHPPTYVNKVLVASAQGSMQLWNIRSESCIHRFPRSSLSLQTGQTSAITVLTHSPAIDIVGLGFASGEIAIYDVRADERLMRMFMDDGAVKSLSFRTDGQPILASASSTGNLALWDLNEGGRLLHLVRGAHDGAISAIDWVPGQPLLVTSGEDNSVKQWAFDAPTAAPRLLKYRSGHHSPPHLMRYYGDDGKQLLTASRDHSLRCTSIVRDSRSFELSQGSLAKKAASLSIPLSSLKLPPITTISYSSTRSKDWDDILSGHSDETCARTWSMQDKKLGKHTFSIIDKNFRSVGSVKAVCVTACGNFGLASSSNGAISMWNLQSGIKRKTFDIGPCPPEVAAHTRGFSSNISSSDGRCVTGLATDPLNRIVIASTLDGTLNLFNFHSTELEHCMIIPSPIVSISLQNNSGLLAIICDDMVVRIIDIEARRVVRELIGFRGRILDATFSSDSRWLITTSMDSVIRTFDIPTGRLIDAFRTSSVATSISFSPTNDFLATSHVDSVGIHLWANRAQYDEISFQTVDESDIVDTELPSLQGYSDEGALDELVPLARPPTTVDVFSAPPQLQGDLVTLTLLPRSRWQTLINLDVIQQRNRPKEPPKAPEKAPFFLPTLPGVEPRFAPQPTAEPELTTGRRPKNLTAASQSVFQEKLAAEQIEGSFENFFAFAKTLSPAALDLELRSLTTVDNRKSFLLALKRRLSSHRDFEAVQALQKVFLAMYANELIADPELVEEMQELLQVQKKESDKILELIASSLGTLGFVKDSL